MPKRKVVNQPEEYGRTRRWMLKQASHPLNNASPSNGSESICMAEPVLTPGRGVISCTVGTEEKSTSATGESPCLPRPASDSDLSGDDCSTHDQFDGDGYDNDAYLPNENVAIADHEDAALTRDDFQYRPDGHDSTTTQPDGHFFPDTEDQVHTVGFASEETDDDLLYNGAPITVSESLTAILSLVQTHRLTGTCLADILELITLHCPTPNKCAKSLFKFHKYFKSMKTPLVKHFYCSVCSAVLDGADSECESGHQNNKFFIEIPLVDQLQKLYKKPGFLQDLNHRFTRSKECPSAIEDIYDGSLYKDLSAPGKLLSNPNNISMAWYSDGAPVYKSTKFSIWPLYMTINELPYRKRVMKENIILAGLWFGSTEPNVDLFLKPMYSQFLELYSGVDIQVPGGGHRKVCGVLLNGTCDTPARALFLNMKTFQGESGCPKCLDEGENYRTAAGGNVRVFPYQEVMVLRTKETHKRHISQAEYARQPVCGVKGDSWLRKIMPDPITGTAIDAMHAIYLGIFRIIMRLLFDSSYHSYNFSRSAYIHVFDEMLTNIHPPNMVQRMPRALKLHMCYLKANELKALFFYYSAPILNNILDAKYFSNFSKLLLGVYLLNRQSVNEDMLNLSQQLLDDFAQEFEVLYGVRFATISVHQVRHLPKMVQDLGPLWVSSCFPYEDLNGKLLSMVHGTTHVGLQIYSSVSYATILPSLVLRMQDTPIKEFCQVSLGVKKKIKINDYLMDAMFSVGKYKKLQVIPAYVTHGVDVGSELAEVWEFYRLKNGRQLYYSKDYQRSVQNMSYCVSFADGNTYSIGLIQRFLKVSTLCNCLGHDCACKPHFYAVIARGTCYQEFAVSLRTRLGNPLGTSEKLPYLYRYQPSNACMLIPVDHLKSLCYFMDLGNRGIYVAEPVNLVETECT